MDVLSEIARRHKKLSDPLVHTVFLSPQFLFTLSQVFYAWKFCSFVILLCSVPWSVVSTLQGTYFYVNKNFIVT